MQLTVPVTKRFEFQLLGTLRLGRNITHPIDERVGAGFNFKASPRTLITCARTTASVSPAT